MISFSEAQNLLFSEATCLNIIETYVRDAVGSVCAETVTNPINIPSFNNSAMDGFALRSEDTVTASSEHPAHLHIVNTIAAGEDNITGIHARNYTVCEIMTGAPLPASCDAVVPIEDVTHITKDEILISRPIKEKENVRYIGEDLSADDILIKKSDKIKPKHIMALAAAGINKIKIIRRPKIAILCTGRELTDTYSNQLRPGQIHNAAYPYLFASLQRIGITANYYGIISDDPKIFFSTMGKILSDSPDVIISTGALSAGKWDFIPQALQDLNAKIFFHKVKVRPGKPILFSKFNNGPYLFGLPGNPIATAVGLRFFVYPLLRYIQGLSKEVPSYARLTTYFMKKADFRFFLKASKHLDHTGHTHVDILQGQESFKIKSLLEANYWVALEEDKTEYHIGDSVHVYPLQPYA